MNWPHPIHIVTLLLVALATVFSFVAMRVAFDARDEAAWAASAIDNTSTYEVQQLEDALVRAGVIDDPTIFRDDHNELDGPWARCLTADERDAMGLGADEAELPSPPCTTTTAELVPCDEPTAVDTEEVDDGVAEECTAIHRINGRRYYLAEPVHPADVEAQAISWLRVEGDEGLDRLVHGPDDMLYVHVLGQGWVAAWPDL